jgi:hypothetical protein
MQQSVLIGHPLPLNTHTPSLSPRTEGIVDKLINTGIDFDNFLPGVWASPTALVSAACRATQAPDGKNNDQGILDFGAVGGEPTDCGEEKIECPDNYDAPRGKKGSICKDDSANALGAVNNHARVLFRVARGSAKEYLYVYDLGKPTDIDAFEILGHSVGNHCEPGKAKGDDVKGVCTVLVFCSHA